MTTPEINEASDAIPPKPRRWLMLCLGVFFVALAAVGVILPGIPTVGPLLLGSYFLTRSSPALEQRLIRNRFFARYLPYLDGTEQMSARARLTSIGLMWCSITLSCLLLYYSSGGPWWLLALIVIAGLVGTVFIWRFGRQQH